MQPMPQQMPPAAPQMAPMPQQAASPMQAQPQASAPGGEMPAQQGQPSGRAGQEYNQQLLQVLDQHLNSLPEPQKAFLVQYMSPELAVLFGIVLGQEAYDYFRQYADPKKQLTVTSRQGQQTDNPNNPSGMATQEAATAPQQQQPPTAQAPGRSIMGV